MCTHSLALAEEWTESAAEEYALSPLHAWEDEGRRMTTQILM
jgi:hypothetical protein